MRWLAVLMLLMLPFGLARAHGDIHRCVGADGGIVFTDRVCSDVNATPAVPAPSASASAAAISPAMAQPPPVLCAADLTELKQAVVDAFADRNPNRLAGLMLWQGDGRASVVANIRQFTRLMAHPLLEISASGDDPAATSSSSATEADPPPARGESLSVTTEAEDGSGGEQETHFAVVRHAGCLWLEPPY